VSSPLPCLTQTQTFFFGNTENFVFLICFVREPPLSLSASNKTPVKAPMAPFGDTLAVAEFPWPEG
jgi:hypothetical protein